MPSLRGRLRSPASPMPIPIPRNNIMESTYSATSIQVLKGLEAVRKRPGMYIGSTGIDGLHHLVYEVVDNSIDEAFAGVCDRIDVVLEKNDVVKVTDNGRGIPTGIHPDREGQRARTGHDQAPCRRQVRQEHRTRFPADSMASAYRSSTPCQPGARYSSTRTAPCITRCTRPACRSRTSRQVGESDKRGTVVRFAADPTIFETTVYSFDVLANRLRELAFLNKGLLITLTDDRLSTPKVHEFKFEGGLREFVDLPEQEQDRAPSRIPSTSAARATRSRSRSASSTTTPSTRRCSPSSTASTPGKAAPTSSASRAR